MNRSTRLRRAAWLWICVGVCAAGFLPQPACAADPVETIQHALQLPVDKLPLRARRLKIMESALPDLKTITQLRTAYFLREWGQLEGDKHQDVLKYRTQLGERLFKAVVASARDPRQANELAIAMWIGKLVPFDQGDQRDFTHDQFARRMTPIILELLKSKDVSVRRAAVYALGRITPNPAAAFPALKNTLQNDEVEPRRLAAYAMTDLLKNIRGYSPRREQIEVMDKIVRTASFSLGDADEAVRGYSLQAILEAAKTFFTYVSAPGEAITVIVQKDKSVLAPDLQGVLKTFQTTMPQLLHALNDSKVNIRLSSLQTLVQICNARAKIVHELRDLNNDLPEKPESASQVLKAHGAPDPLAAIIERDWPAITRVLRDDDERLRLGAMEFLEVLGEQAAPALPEITQALHDSSSFVRWGAARALRNMPPSKVSNEAIRGLAFLLMDADPDVSKGAALTLIRLGPVADGAVDALSYMIANDDPQGRAWDAENRIAAMRALASIGAARTRSAIPSLTSALSDADARIRRKAAATLGLYGAAAQSALPALMRALRDEDDEAASNAAEAIITINGPGAQK